MKKQMLKRGYLGLTVGITIGYAITILISMTMADGGYYPAAPALIQTMGNEINAVILQAVLCGVMGAGCAMASLIWDIDTWSIVKQSGVYFAILAAIILPIAYIANWMEHTLVGFLSYFGIFLGISVIVWMIQYFAWKAKVKKLNDGVKK